MLQAKPILFTGPNVQLILQGKKTQTRRVVTPDARKRYAVGSLLWVRERMRVVLINRRKGKVTEIEVEYEADGTRSGLLEYPVRLRAEPEIGKCLPYGGYREATRLLLNVLQLRRESLQAMTHVDAMAEGCEDVYDHKGRMVMTARSAYIELWNSINLRRGYPWLSNPQVVAITFEAAGV